MRSELSAALVWLVGISLTTAAYFFLSLYQSVTTKNIDSIFPISHATFVFLAGVFITAYRARIAAAGPNLHRIPGLLRDLRGQVAIVTGAASGIGLCTALELAMRGATVVLGCRSTERIQGAARQIRKLCAQRHGAERAANLDLVVDGCPALELESFASVDAFASWALSRFKSVVLVQNAGIIPSSDATFSRNEKDLEQTLCVNFLAPLLLAELLVPITKRVVIVSSSEHNFDLSPIAQAKRQFEELCLVQKGVSSLPSPMTRYRFSKLGNVYHAHYIASTHVKRSGVSSVAVVHPGFCITNIANNVVPAWITDKLAWFATFALCKTDEEGATCSLFAALVIDEATVLNKFRPFPNSDNRSKNNKIDVMATYLCDTKPAQLGDAARSEQACNEVMEWALNLLRDRKWLR